MMAGAEDPATLSGLCQPMARAMVNGVETSSQRNRVCDGRVAGVGEGGKGTRSKSSRARSRLELAGSHRRREVEAEDGSVERRVGITRRRERT